MNGRNTRQLGGKKGQATIALAADGEAYVRLVDAHSRDEPQRVMDSYCRSVRNRQSSSTPYVRIEWIKEG